LNAPDLSFEKLESRRTANALPRQTTLGHTRAVAFERNDLRVRSLLEQKLRYQNPHVGFPRSNIEQSQRPLLTRREAAPDLLQESDELLRFLLVFSPERRALLAKPNAMESGANLRE